MAEIPHQRTISIPHTFAFGAFFIGLATFMIAMLGWAATESWRVAVAMAGLGLLCFVTLVIAVTGYRWTR